MRPPPFAVIDGRVRSRQVELNVVDHCNLACRACSHLSPTMPRRAVDPVDVERDLVMLGRVYHAERIRLLGGEPLLHSDLEGVIRAVRSSGVADEVHLVTNGVLLGRLSAAMWRLLDRVEVSAYPTREPNAATLAEAEQRAEESGTTFVVRRPTTFRQSYSESGTADTELVGRIFSTCRLVHQWGCHTVASGRFYKCAPSHYIPRVVDRGESLAEDGVRIHDGNEFADQLASFLGDATPLASCTFCLGSAGRLIDHEQVDSREFRSYQEAPTEDLVDRPFLRYMELADRVLGARRADRSEWKFRALVNRLRRDGVRALQR